MNGQAIPLFERPETHSRIRRSLTAAWNNRKPGYKFRNIKTSGFTSYGSGLTWLQIRKHEETDTFVVGCRNWGEQASYYAERGIYVPPNVDRERWIPFAEVEKHGHRFPIEDTLHRFFMVCKPNRTFMPAMYDMSRNNLMWGLGHAWLQSYRAYGIPARCKVHTFGFCNNNWAVSQGLEITDEGVYGVGTSIRNPELQVYDKALYRQIREAAREGTRVLNVFRRHGLFHRGHAYRGWPEEVYKWFFNHYQRSTKPFHFDDFWPMYQGAVKEAGTWGYDPYTWKHRNSNDPVVAIPTESVVRRQMYEIGLKIGVYRVAPKGYELYNEVPPWEPQSLDYVDLIYQQD